MNADSPKRVKKKKASPYAFIGFRPTPILDKRLRSLSEESGQSVSAIIKECVSAHLCRLEDSK
jgi:predicted DNA-binding protein